MVALQRRLSSLKKLLNSKPDDLSTIAEDTTVTSKSVTDERSFLKSTLSVDSTKEREEHLLEEYGYYGISTAMRMYVRSLRAAEMESADRDAVGEAEKFVDTINENYEEREGGRHTREAIDQAYEDDVSQHHSFEIGEVSLNSVKRSCVSTLTIDEKHTSEPAKRVKDALSMRLGMAGASEHDTTLEILTAESTDDRQSTKSNSFTEQKSKTDSIDSNKGKETISGGYINMVRQLSDMESKQSSAALSRNSSRAGSVSSFNSKPRSILKKTSRSGSLATKSMNSVSTDPAYSCNNSVVGSIASEKKSVKISAGKLMASLSSESKKSETCPEKDPGVTSEGDSKDVSILSSNSLKISVKKVEEILSIPIVNDFHSSPISLTKKDSGTGSMASRLIAKLSNFCESKPETDKQVVIAAKNDDSEETIEIPAVSSANVEEARSIPAVIDDFQSATGSMASKFVANLKKMIDRKSETRNQEVEATNDETPTDPTNPTTISDMGVDSEKYSCPGLEAVKDNSCLGSMIVEIKNIAEEPGRKSPQNKIDAATREYGIWVDEIRDRVGKAIALDHGAPSSIACDGVVKIDELYQDFQKSIERTFFPEDGLAVDTEAGDKKNDELSMHGKEREKARDDENVTTKFEETNAVSVSLLDAEESS